MSRASIRARGTSTSLTLVSREAVALTTGSVTDTLSSTLSKGVGTVGITISVVARESYVALETLSNLGDIILKRLNVSMGERSGESTRLLSGDGKDIGRPGYGGDSEELTGCCSSNSDLLPSSKTLIGCWGTSCD